MNQPGDVLVDPSARPQAPYPRRREPDRYASTSRPATRRSSGGLPQGLRPGRYPHVEDERGVYPPRVRANIGQIRHPQHVGCVGGELPLHSIRRPRSLGPVTVRSPPTLQTVIFPVAHLLSSIVPRCAGPPPFPPVRDRVYLAGPVHPEIVGVNRPDLGQHFAVTHRTCRFGPLWVR